MRSLRRTSFNESPAFNTQKIWDLEADHVHWIDDHRLAGDLNTKGVLPSGIVLFDGTASAAEPAHFTH